MIASSFSSNRAIEPIRRTSYDIKEKRYAVSQVEALVQSGLSKRRACETVGVKYLYFRRWQKLLEKIEHLKEAGHFYAYNLKGTARKIHVGREGILKPVEKQLTAFAEKGNKMGGDELFHI